MRIAIVTDTNSGITAEEGKQIGIYVLPMPVLIDDTCYLEGIDIGHEQMYEAMESGHLTTTSQPSPGDIMKLWDSVLDDGYDGIVHIPMASDLSGSCRTAALLAQEYHGKVQVADNHRISVSQRESVLEAKAMADVGHSAMEIKEYLEKTAGNASIYVTVASLQYLQRGGRLSSTSAAIGSVLNIKPILTIQGGKIEVFSKCRGMKMCEKTMIDSIKKDIANRFAHISTENLQIVTAGTLQKQEDVDHWLDTVKSAFPNMDVYYDPLPCSIVSHIGPNSMGVGVVVTEYR